MACFVSNPWYNNILLPSQIAKFHNHIGIGIVIYFEGCLNNNNFFVTCRQNLVWFSMVMIIEKSKKKKLKEQRMMG